MIPTRLKGLVYGIALRIQGNQELNTSSSELAENSSGVTQDISEEPTDSELRLSQAHDIQDKIHTTLVYNRSRYLSPTLEMNSREQLLSSSTLMSETLDEYELDSDNEYIRRYRREISSVDPFVLEQNRKFDDLIQKNLLVYEQEQKELEAIAAAAALVSEGKTTNEDMVGVFSSINKIEEYVLGRIVDISVSRVVGSVSPGILQRTLKGNHGSWLFSGWGGQKDNENEELEGNEEDSADQSDEDMKQLVEEEKRKIQVFISSLDDESKQIMFDQLSQQMDDYVVMSTQDYNDVVKKDKFDGAGLGNKTGKTSLLDKFEQATILTIKIFFVMLKLSIPMAKYFYTKFLANEYFLFNYNNFNRFIQFMINLLHSLESELQTNTVLAQFQHKMDNLNEQERRRLFYIHEREQLERELDVSLNDKDGDSGILLILDEDNNSSWGSGGRLVSSFVTSISSSGGINPSTPPSENNSRFEEITLADSTLSTSVNLQDPKYMKYFSPSKRLVRMGFIAEEQGQVASRSSTNTSGSAGSSSDDERLRQNHISVLDAAEMFAEQL